MTKLNNTSAAIDALLPQTQCGLCGYGGCLPYAEAIADDNAPINLCPPGGVPTLKELGTLLEIDIQPYLADMQAKAKPKQVATIRESECIGCTKCIQACPVDAILGSGKLMHTVISDECTGCELCIPPCPVDCIDLLSTQKNPSKEHARARFTAQTSRLQQEALQKEAKKQEKSLQKRKAYVEDALARVRAKRKSLTKYDEILNKT